MRERFFNQSEKLKENCRIMPDRIRQRIERAGLVVVGRITTPGSIGNMPDFLRSGYRMYHFSPD